MWLDGAQGHEGIALREQPGKPGLGNRRSRPEGDRVYVSETVGVVPTVPGQVLLADLGRGLSLRHRPVHTQGEEDLDVAFFGACGDQRLADAAEEALCWRRTTLVIDHEQDALAMQIALT